MPRLVAGRNAEEKKEQILYMKAHTLGSEDNFMKKINVAASKGKELHINPYDWSNDEINFFYDKIITDAEIKAYDEAIKRDKENLSAEQRKKEKYELVKPTNERFGMSKKKADIENMKLSDEEKAEKLKELEEEFEFRTLECRNKILSDLSSEELGRMMDLEEKLMPKFYDEKTHELEMLEKEREEVVRKISKSTHKSVNPLVSLWNNIQKLWSGNDIEAVAKNKEYKDLVDRKMAIDSKRTEIDGWRRGVKETFKNSFAEREKKNADKKYTNTYELAKAIVEMTAKQDDPDLILDPVVVETNAVALMESKYFNHTVEELIVDDTGIEAKKFYGAMMKNMEKNKTEFTPKTTDEIVNDKSKDKANDKVNENTDKKVTRSNSVDLTDNVMRI